jgi:hypothetical protein
MALPKELMKLSKGELVQRYLSAINSLKLVEEKFKSTRKRKTKIKPCVHSYGYFHSANEFRCTKCGEVE